MTCINEINIAKCDSDDFLHPIMEIKLIIFIVICIYDSILLNIMLDEVIPKYSGELMLNKELIIYLTV